LEGAREHRASDAVVLFLVHWARAPWACPGTGPITMKACGFRLLVLECAKIQVSAEGGRNNTAKTKRKEESREEKMYP